MLLLTSLCLSVLFRQALSLSPTHMACQLQKSGEPALTGCQSGTLYVSKTDPAADFTSVQDAINSLHKTANAIILIGTGEYGESIEVKHRGSLTLLGQLNPSTATSGTASQHNTVVIWNKMYQKDGVTEEETATLAVISPHRNFDFKAYNIKFANYAAEYPIGPALAVYVMWAYASFYGCSFESYQDTWYTGDTTYTYAKDCDIYGYVDFIYGHGTSWFQSVNIYNRGCGGAVTTWMGTPGTTKGVYIADSSITRSLDANSATVTAGQCHLSRPWDEYGVAVFLRTYMDDSIAPAGFVPWNWQHGTIPDTVFFAEFESRGPGGDTSARVQQDHILDSTEAEKYTIGSVFGGMTSWIDFEYQ